MAHYKFAKDKMDGDTAEQHLLEHIQKLYPKAYREIGKVKEHDIVIPELQKTIEVKNDLKAEETGNIAIEISKKDGTPTGINVSTANWWAIFANKELFFLERKKLKTYCETSKLRTVFGGDNWGVKMYLIPIEELKKQDFFVKVG